MSKLDIPFNNPMTYPGHSGVDFPQSQGTPFLASDSGVVEWLGKNDRGGYFIWVRYDSIRPRVGYHHMPSHEYCPGVGRRFEYGERLGVVGSTGNSTGPHLHSEVEGYATTDGYWMFFNPNRVVGTKSVIKPVVLEDVDMPVVYIDVKGTVFALNTITGERRQISATEWRSVRRAYKAAGRAVPLGAWNDSLNGL